MEKEIDRVPVVTTKFLCDLGINRKTAYRYIEQLKKRGWRKYDPEVDGDALVNESDAHNILAIVRDEF